MTTVIEELEAALRQVTEQVGPSVVRIGRGRGRGAGVVLSDGVVLTNAHNLRGDETTVTFADGRAAVGTVRGIDGDGDVVVLAVDTTGAPPIGWEPTDASVGTAVVALSSPPGHGPRATLGFVSAVGQTFRGPRGRRIAGSIEHTAPLTRGSSGGPVVDTAGRLVGINTNRVGDGFYLAMPADADLKARVDALTRGESPQRLRLGVALVPGHAARRLRAAVGLPARDGLLVRGVEDEGPAARAGIRQGDLLVAAGGTALNTHDDLFTALDAATGPLALTVVRGVEELDVTIAFDAA
jgi:serine protease Do